MSERARAVTALTMSTVAFAVCFACWVLNAVLITFLATSGAYAFDETQIGWLLAVPILTGALIRLPLGMLTDRYGGRIVFPALMLASAIPMYLLSLADSYAEFLLASLGLGCAGGSFAVGISYVSVWFKAERQGTALGVFGMGSAGAAFTTTVAPILIAWFTAPGASIQGWRLLPRTYAAALVVTAIVFYALTGNRRSSEAGTGTLAARLSPLRSIVVWRLGFYYSLVFGAFVALAQWIVPYSVNVYQMPVAQAGMVAAVFSLPSGVIRAMGGWLSDRFGARTVMYWVFSGSAVTFLFLSIPKMDIVSPGEGLSATTAGIVTAVSPEAIVVNERIYRLTPPPARTAAEKDQGTIVLPRVISWHEPVVSAGDAIEKRQMIARGVTNIYYPANVWIFAALVLILGVTTGVGTAGVYKFIPEQFPGAVGAVGGAVGLIGALGGFVYPIIFGSLLRWTGLWASCWMLLTVVSLACLVWLHAVVRRIMQEEVPELVQLIERRHPMAMRGAIPTVARGETMTAESLLRNVPFFSDLTKEQLQNLARIGARPPAAANEIVFREGDPGDSVYVILTGAVTVSRTDHDGGTVELARLTEGDFFGELALVDGEPRSATVATTAPCEFLVIGRRDFLTALSKSTSLLANFLVGLSVKIRRSNEQFFELVLKKERLRAQTEIERHRSIAQMVAGVAHEINTPLGIVNQAASIIADALTPRTIASLAHDDASKALLSDLAEASNLIQANAARADTLIRSFKNLSVRQLTDSKETVDLRKLTEEVLGLYKLKARESMLHFEIKDQLGDSDREWVGYPGYFSQIMLNLITNVDRYAYPEGMGGKAEIVLSRIPGEGKAQRFSVVVRDFGLGIPPEDLPKVFDPFFTTGRAKGGTGLGLAIVYNLVTTPLEGYIRIESAPGQGTAIIMTFPAAVSGEGLHEGR